MSPDEIFTGYDEIPAKQIVKVLAPMYIPVAYNTTLLGLTEITKTGFPPGFEESSLPSIIYERCNCAEGARFADLMQDMFLNTPPQLLEGLAVGGILGALGGALVGGIHGARNSKTLGGKVKSAFSGALVGGAFGSMLGASSSNTALFNSATEYFGEWSGDGLSRFNESVGYGVNNVAAMALLYPIMIGLSFLPLFYLTYKAAKPLIKQGENLTEILHENGVV